MTAVLICRELLFATRIYETAARAGVQFIRIDDPSQLPEATSVQLVLVDWADRDAGWAAHLIGWRAGAPESSRARIVLFGPHTDMKAHDAARNAGLGPMWARSRLLTTLPDLL